MAIMNIRIDFQPVTMAITTAIIDFQPVTMAITTAIIDFQPVTMAITTAIIDFQPVTMVINDWSETTVKMTSTVDFLLVTKEGLSYYGRPTHLYPWHQLAVTVVIGDPSMTHDQNAALWFAEMSGEVANRNHRRYLPAERSVLYVEGPARSRSSGGLNQEPHSHRAFRPVCGCLRTVHVVQWVGSVTDVVCWWSGCWPSSYWGSQRRTRRSPGVARHTSSRPLHACMWGRVAGSGLMGDAMSGGIARHGTPVVNIYQYIDNPVTSITKYFWFNSHNTVPLALVAQYDRMLLLPQLWGN